MKAKDFKTLENLLKEYKIKEQYPTPSGAQTSGSNAKANQNKQTSSITKKPPSPTTAPVKSPTSAQSFSPTTTANGIDAKPEQEPLVSTTPGDIETDTVIKDKEGNEMGTVVSSVGKKPNPDALVVKNSDGYSVVDTGEEIYVDNPDYTEESVFDKFDKLSLEEQLSIISKVDKKKIDNALNRSKTIDVIESALPKNDRVDLLNHLLSDHLPAGDLQKQFHAYWAVPVPAMIDSFRAIRAQGGDDACLRPVLTSFAKQYLPKQEQEKINFNEE